MISISEELLEQIIRGNVLLFIGDRIVHDAEGETFLDRLAVQLAARCGIVDPETLTFPEIAQAYEDEQGRQALVQFVRDQLEALGDEPQQAHRLIAGLTDCNVLVTTCLDRRLEQAFEQVGRPLDAVIGNLDVAFENESKARLYKLHGSVDRLESLLLTEDDYARFEDQTPISVVLQGYLARKTILFIGYDLAHPYFERLYRKVMTPLDKYARRAYAFGETPPPRVVRWCKRHGINVVKVDATAFLEALTEQLQAQIRPVHSVVPHPVKEVTELLLERPYKSLDYYETQDANIFFGRNRETQLLSSLIHAHRLVLLYGASGTGKTSLLLAGVAARVERVEPPYETIYVRALEDPAIVIRREVQWRLPETPLPTEGALVNFLATVTRALDRTLVIIIDQFEEFFIRLSPQIRAAFIDELSTLYYANNVPVKIVLSLREDWLASVSELEERIPEVFRIQLRLLPLDRDQARLSITGPAAKLKFSYEPTLVDQLLDDLVSGEDTVVMPPQLQLVCSTLYDNLKPGEHLITMATYERLDKAQGILQKHLQNELARLGTQERVLARAILEELVTSQGTKAVKKAEELALALDLELADVKSILEKLIRARLLRLLEVKDEGIAYELAHEYLIRQISPLPEVQQRKQTEELVQQELMNWHLFKTLLGADKLDLIWRMGKVLRLSPEAQELLLRSALVTRHKASSHWLEQVTDEIRRAKIVRDCLADNQVAVRSWTVQILRTWHAPIVGEMLLTTALNDETAQVRQQAAVSLAHWDDPTVSITKLIRTENASEDRIYEVLTYIFDEVEQLPGLPWQTRLRVRQISLKRLLGQVRAFLFYRSLSGGIGASVAVGLFMVLFGYYVVWPLTKDTFGDLTRSNVASFYGLIGSSMGFILGASTSLGLTLADIMVKKRKIYTRMLGGMLGGGIGMGGMFLLINFASGFVERDRPYFIVLIGGFMIGSLTSGGVALAIPEIGTSRSLLKQTILGASGGAVGTGLAVVLFSLLTFQVIDTYRLMVMLAYVFLTIAVSIGIALGLGILDRLNLYEQVKEK